MSVRVERAVQTVNKTRVKETIVDFAAEKLKAPFSLRCGALLIDYIFIISVPVLALIIGRLLGNDGAKLLNSELINAGWMITVLLVLTDFVIFPMFAGQSIGKMLTGVRIVKTNGHPASFTNLLMRHLIGYPLTLATLGLGFLFAAVNSKGRALHDYLAGTVVIYGQRRLK